MNRGWRQKLRFEKETAGKKELNTALKGMKRKAMLYLTVKKKYLEVEMLSQKASKAHPENLHFFPFHLHTNTTPP